MRYLERCELCHANDKSDTVSIGKRVLYRGKYIYVAVDIAPLCIGHLLIITKEHYFNFYETGEVIKEETEKIKGIIKNIFQKIYHSETLFFEHGSAIPGEAGSSVDHAHLHAIPCKIDLKNILDNLLGNSIECDIFSKNYHNEFSYIYLEDINKKVIYKVDKLPSQYLRKTVGEKLNNNNYDWRMYCKSLASLQMLEQTYIDLKGKIK